MKLWLKGISGSWWETAGEPGQVQGLMGSLVPFQPPTLSAHLPVTQGSLWLLRELQGSMEPRLVSAPQTCSFIPDTVAPSLAALRRVVSV